MLSHTKVVLFWVSIVLLCPKEAFIALIRFRIVREIFHKSEVVRQENKNVSKMARVADRRGNALAAVHTKRGKRKQGQSALQ